MGPTITHIRSSKLDSWMMEQIEAVEYVGNDIANKYWEFNMPKSFSKLNTSSSLEER